MTQKTGPGCTCGFRNQNKWGTSAHGCVVFHPSVSQSLLFALSLEATMRDRQLKVCAWVWVCEGGRMLLISQTGSLEATTWSIFCPTNLSATTNHTSNGSPQDWSICVSQSILINSWTFPPITVAVYGTKAAHTCLIVSVHFAVIKLFSQITSVWKFNFLSLFSFVLISKFCWPTEPFSHPGFLSPFPALSSSPPLISSLTR